MKRIHRNVLRKETLAIKRSLSTEDTVGDMLYAKGIFSEDLNATVLRHKGNPKEQAQIVLSNLPRSGTMAWGVFIDALRLSETAANRELAEILLDSLHECEQEADAEEQQERPLDAEEQQEGCEDLQDQSSANKVGESWLRKITARFHLILRNGELFLARKAVVEYGVRESSVNLSDFPNMEVRAYFKQLDQEHQEDRSSYGACMTWLGIETEFGIKSLWEYLYKLKCQYDQAIIAELQSEIRLHLAVWADRIGYVREQFFITNFVQVVQTAIDGHLQSQPPSIFPLLREVIAASIDPFSLPLKISNRLKSYINAQQRRVEAQQRRVEAEDAKNPSKLGEGMLPEFLL